MILNLLLLSSAVPIVIPISHDNPRLKLIRPGLYYGELEYTGGKNCTNIFDCSSNICDIITDHKVCLCYENQAKPDCSYKRVSKELFAFTIIPGFSALIWFSIGYVDIGVITLILSGIFIIAFSKIINRPKYKSHNMTAIELIKQSKEEKIYKCWKVILYIGFFHYILCIVLVIYASLNDIHDSNGYGLY